MFRLERLFSHYHVDSSDDGGEVGDRDKGDDAGEGVDGDRGDNGGDGGACTCQGCIEHNAAKTCTKLVQPVKKIS